MGSLFFWVGPTLQNPKKTVGKFKFRKFLDKPILCKPQKPRGKPHLENTLGPQKISGRQGKIQILSPVHRGKNHKEYLDKLVLQNPETLRKNPCFELFLGPLKIAENRGKIQNFEACTLRGNCKKIRILKPGSKISQLANPPIFLLFLLTSASK